MNVNELKEHLHGLAGDLQVRLVTYHGHIPMTCISTYEGWISEDSYMPDEVHEDDRVDESFKVLILEGF